MSETKKPPQLTAAIAKKLLAGLPDKIERLVDALKTLPSTDPAIRDFVGSLRKDATDILNWRLGYGGHDPQAEKQHEADVHWGNYGAPPKRREHYTLLDSHVGSLLRCLAALHAGKRSITIDQDTRSVIDLLCDLRSVLSPVDVTKDVAANAEVISENDPRDRYIYDAWNRGDKSKIIMDHVKAQEAWQPIYTLTGLKKAGNAYANRKGLPPLNPRTVKQQ
jgi:hypothetical protein